MHPIASGLPRRRIPNPIQLDNLSNCFPTCFCLWKRFLRVCFSAGPSDPNPGCIDALKGDLTRK
jgi:hypothetical protein